MSLKSRLIEQNKALAEHRFVKKNGEMHTDLQYNIKLLPLDLGNGALEIGESMKDIASFQKAVAESINTTTTGASSAITPGSVMVIPSGLAAPVRDVVAVAYIIQGADGVQYCLVTAPVAGALGQGVEPALAVVTLSNELVALIDSQRGVESQISLEADQKIPGIHAATILSHRIAESLDENYLVLSQLDGISTGSLAGVVFPGSITAENQIVSTNTLTGSMLAQAEKLVNLLGYDVSETVAFLHPKQYNDLTNDPALVRYLRYPGDQPGNSAICYYGDLEIRRSSQVPSGANGSGSPATTTYHGYLWVKQKSIALAVSQDLTVEAFRDLHLSAYVIKTHYDLAFKAIVPQSIVRLTSA